MEFLSYLISGISLGSVYAIIALGYTMVYGILRLINFAHGDVFMCAGLMMVFMCAALPVYVSIPLMLVLTVLGYLGIPMTPFITMMGACGAAVALALKDSLGNFAGGILIIFNQPFKKGDFIECAGVTGRVQ